MQYTVAIDGVNVSISQLNIVTTVDRTLDYGTFLVRNKKAEAYDVGTSVDIDVTDGEDTLNYHFIIQADDVQKIKGGTFIHSIDIIELTKILEWQTESVRTFTQVIGGLTLSLLDVVTRLQTSIPMVRNEDVASTRIFAIEPALVDILREIEAPEFVFSNKNFKEILTEIFDFIGALPRLIKVSNNIVLTADFYNKRKNKINEDDFSRMERFNINDFSTALDADLKNLFDNYTEVTDPGPNIYKRLYASNGDFSQENLILKTDYPIIDVVSLKVKTDLIPAGVSNVNNPGSVLTNIIIDLTPCILERELWENLTNAGFTSSFERGQYRDNTLFFNRFNPDITNLYDVVGAFANAPIVAGTERLEAVIARALALSDITYDDNGTPKKLLLGRTPRISNYAEIEFQIIYKAQIDSRTEVKRLDTRRIKFESQSYTGQIDNVVRADRVLDKLFKTQQLLGNAEIITSERTRTLDKLFLLGDYTDDDYILTTAEFQFDKNYVTAKYMWTQNFNKVSEFIGLNSAIRLFPIPNDTYQRNVYLEDVIEVGTTLKSNSSDVTTNGIATFMNTINNSPSVNLNRPITNIAFENPVATSFNVNDDIIVKPITAYAGGNSINFHFEFNNVSVAGWQIEIDSELSSQTLSFDDIDDENPAAPTAWEVIGSFISAGWSLFLNTDTVGTTTAVSYKAAQDASLEGNTISTVFKKPIVNGIYYVDNNGFVGVFSFELINGFTTSNSGLLPVVPKQNLGTKLVTGSNYLVMKDAREELAMTYAIHVLPEPTFEKTFIIGKYLVERNNLLKSISTASNQFEVFTSTDAYDVTENQFSRSTDIVSVVTYSISSNGLTLSANITAAVWGIRKKSTKELVIAVNQGEDVIRTIYFNFRDTKSGIVAPSQNVVIPPAVLRPASFQVVPPLPTSSVVNLAWTDPNSSGVDSFEFGYSTNLVNWTSEVITGNTKQVTGLDPLTFYTFRIRGRIDDDFSEYVYATATTLVPPPPAPQNVATRLMSERRVHITWDDIDNAFLYRIEISESNTFSTLIQGGLKSSFTNFFILDFLNTPSLEFNKEYFVRIRALESGVFGSYSDTVDFETLEGPIAAPPLITNVVVTGSTVTYTLVNTHTSPVTLFADFNSNPTTQRGTTITPPNEAVQVSQSFSGSDSTIFAKATSTVQATSPVVSVQFASNEPPGTPSITSIVPNVGNNVVNWSYSGTFIDGFYVLRAPSLTGASEDVVVGYISPTIFRFVDFNVGSQISYTYRVVATNNVGIQASAPSTVNSTTMTPTPPSLLTVSQYGFSSPEGDVLLQLNWQSNSAGSEDGFNLKLGSNVVSGTVRFVTETDYVVNVPAGDTITFNFSVVAYNIYGDSAASNTASVTITG